MKIGAKKAILLLQVITWVLLVFGLSLAMTTGFGHLYKTFLAKYLNLNQLVLAQVITFLLYGTLITFLIFLPKILKFKTANLQRLGFNWREVGFKGLPRWQDIGLALGGVILYLILTIALMSLANAVIPGFNLEQKQELGFKLSFALPHWQKSLAYLGLVVFVPIVEETVFRGYLFAKLNRFLSIVSTSFIVSLLFGLAHGQWNVGVDTFALSLAMCLVRQLSGTIYPSILMHIIKNSVAFYALMFTMGV